MHALSLLQSVLRMHSGLQFGGLPKNPAAHVQECIPPISRQSALSPHGDGTHGLIGSIKIGSVGIISRHIVNGSPV